MILYLDSSAIVKLDVDEPLASVVHAAVAEAAACCSHLIAYAEVRAALAKAVRLKRETPEDLALHKGEFDEDWERFRVVSVTEASVRRAADLAERFGLRGYDSAHLAAAEAVREGVGSRADFRFLGFDDQQRKAALALGMQLLTG